MRELQESITELVILQREMLVNQVNQQKTLDRHSELLEKQSEILLRNTITVERHERRSTLLEEEIKRVDSEVSDIKDHVTSIRGIGKFFKWAGVIAGSLTAIGAALMGLFQLMQKLGL